MLGIKCYFLEHKMHLCTQTDKAMVLRVSLSHWLSIHPHCTDGMILRTEASCGHSLTQIYASIYSIIPNIIISSCSSKNGKNCTQNSELMPRSNTVNDIMGCAGILWKERKRNFPWVKCAIATQGAHTPYPMRWWKVLTSNRRSAGPPRHHRATRGLTNNPNITP